MNTLFVDYDYPAWAICYGCGWTLYFNREGILPTEMPKCTMCDCKLSSWVVSFDPLDTFDFYKKDNQ